MCARHRQILYLLNSAWGKYARTIQVPMRFLIMEVKMPKKIEMWKCELCGEEFYDEKDCIRHETIEKRVEEANKMLNDGATLKEINDKYQFWRNLPKQLEPVTKHHCFVVSHWQCCDKPAYQITSLIMYGTVYPDIKLHLWGCGSWNGYYGGDVDINHYVLRQPHNSEELFIDKRYGRL